MAKNVETKIVGTNLVITIDLSKEFGPSGSGKTIIVASTEGSINVEGHEGMKIGLNVFKYPPKKPA